MGKRVDKRGISTLIGSVFLVALVMVMGLAAFLFGRNLMGQVKERALEEKLCSEVSFSLGNFCHDIQPVHSLEGQSLGNRYYIQFNGRNNIADSRIDGFLLSIDYGGNIIPRATHPLGDGGFGLGGGETETLTTDNLETIDGIRLISVIPKIISDNKPIICNKNYKIFEWSEIRAC